MAEHVISLKEEQEKAGVTLLGSTEAVTAELQRICDYSANPWVTKVAADAAASSATAAAEIKTRYDKLPKEKQEQVDAILASAAAVEEPIEGEVTP